MKKAHVLLALILCSLILTLILYSLFIYLPKTRLIETPPEDWAAYYAPVIYQLTSSLNTRADYFTRFDYDGDWVGNNNWENLDFYQLPAYVYYAYSETETHIFIMYSIYYPRDWMPLPLSIDSEHENDLGYILLCIEKTENPYGKVRCMLTDSHHWSFPYVMPNSGLNEIHGALRGGIINMEGSHPCIWIESGGHGVCGEEEDIIFHYEDGVVIYRCNNSAKEPINTKCSYDLLSIDELWERRNDKGGAGHTYERYGVFDGDKGSCGLGVRIAQSDAASTPWGKTDCRFADPARIIRAYFSGWEGKNFSLTYLYNPYLDTQHNPLQKGIEQRLLHILDWLIKDPIYPILKFILSVEYEFYYK